MAIEFLGEGKLQECQNLLKKCEALLVRDLKERGHSTGTLKLLSITLNNLACFCKK